MAPDSLTPRQRDVLRLIAEGWPTRELARRLGLSVKTVETHRSHLYRRLHLRGVARLTRYAVWAGLVPPDPWTGGVLEPTPEPATP